MNLAVIMVKKALNVGFLLLIKLFNYVMSVVLASGMVIAVFYYVMSVIRRIAPVQVHYLPLLIVLLYWWLFLIVIIYLILAWTVGLSKRGYPSGHFEGFVDDRSIIMKINGEQLEGSFDEITDIYDGKHYMLVMWESKDDNWRYIFKKDWFASQDAWTKFQSFIKDKSVNNEGPML